MANLGRRMRDGLSNGSTGVNTINSQQRRNKQQSHRLLFFDNLLRNGATFQANRPYFRSKLKPS